MITNHGMHEWQLLLGLPDTGGQNVFVNQFTEALVKQGFRVTIVNRGGYAHPENGTMHRGLVYKDSSSRILYIEDSVKEFVRKEDMHERLSELGEFLIAALNSEAIPIDLILSHYWDAAMLGMSLKSSLSGEVPHIWIPHSLGIIKKRNVAPSNCEHLRIPERIAAERQILREIDGVVVTSESIREVLKAEYGYEPMLLLPPFVNPDWVYPHAVSPNAAIWSFLAECSGLPIEVVQRSKLVTEISRTVRTKRKDLLIKAFAQALKRAPEVLLAMNLDKNRSDLTAWLQKLVEDLGLSQYVIFMVGEVRDKLLPDLYAITSVYGTPSVMEGFGMSVEEAAASGVPVVSSDRVPFVVEHLVGAQGERKTSGKITFTEGPGAIYAPADDVESFGAALESLLLDDEKRREMGRQAHRITIPAFTADHLVKDFLNNIPIAS